METHGQNQEIVVEMLPEPGYGSLEYVAVETQSQLKACHEDKSQSKGPMEKVQVVKLMWRHRCSFQILRSTVFFLFCSEHYIKLDLRC